MRAAVRFEGTGKRFRGREGRPVEALAGLDFAAEAGAITCLLGPTGCGKTTALRLAAGLEAPDAGRVLVGGAPPASDGAGVGFVPQQHTLFPWLRLVDNVAFPLRLQGRPRRERRRTAAALLARVGLGERTRAFPHECSGGMRQRAMLARLLAGGATRWFLDEPFASLDERTRHHLQALLPSLRDERGLDILFVTHDIDEAVALADRIVVLTPGPGRVAATLEVDLARPRDRLSTAFSGLAEAARRHLESAILREEGRAGPDPRGVLPAGASEMEEQKEGGERREGG